MLDIVTFSVISCGKSFPPLCESLYLANKALWLTTVFFLYWIPLFCRSVGKTAMNEQSSRSHCVFTLRISGVNEVLLGYNLMKLEGYSEYCPQISSWCYCCTYSIVLHCRVQSSRFMEYWISLIWLEVSVFHAVVPQGIVSKKLRYFCFLSQSCSCVTPSSLQTNKSCMLCGRQ
jgi:hypothetical protein